MADTVTLRAFDLSEALNGATLALSTDGTADGQVKDYALYFRQAENGDYVANISKKSFVFGEDGVGLESDGSPKLFIVDTEIKETTGTQGTRADGIHIDINTLQPREQFALSALVGMLGNVGNPLELGETAMKILIQQAFKTAAGMMNAAADYRIAAGETEPETPTEIDEDSLTSNSDKLLNNISKGLTNILEQLKNGVAVTNPGEDRLGIDGGGGIDYDSLADMGTGVENAIGSLPVFNASGALGKSTLEKVREAVLDKGEWIASVETPESLFDSVLYPAVVTAVFAAIKDDVQALVDEAVKAAIENHIKNYHTTTS